MSKKSEAVDPVIVLILATAKAVESMTRIGAGKEHHDELVKAIAAVEAPAPDAK